VGRHCKIKPAARFLESDYHAAITGFIEVGRIMTHVEEVADRTYRVQAQLPGLPTIFSLYFIQGDPGVLIEPGPAGVVPLIQDTMKQLAISDLKYIIPTHIHLDHGGACGTLAQLYPRAEVVVHPQGARHIIDPSRLVRSTAMAFGEDFEKVYGTILPVPESQVKIVQDGETLYVDGRELRVIHTPGHAPHHMAIFDLATQGLFCGEALGLVYSDGAEALPAVAPPGFDEEDYLSSMELLRQLRPLLLFYAHGSVSTAPAKSIDSVIANTREVGEAILDAARAETTEEAIIQSIGEFIRNRFGATLTEYDLASNVRGYLHYFKKKGLV
jgi:glyoxylase-like metal-dependent hydrolase (beta-lactamase superfamily II)